MILIDSYGWIEYFTNGPLSDAYAPYIENANMENTVTPTIVLYEVYRKIKSVVGERKALEACSQILQTKMVELDGKLALEAADISLATSLGMADSIILATAKAYNAEVVTSDKHLKDIAGVKFIGERNVKHHQ